MVYMSGSCARGYDAAAAALYKDAGTCDGALGDLTGFSPVAVCLACELNMEVGVTLRGLTKTHAAACTC